MLSRSYQRCLEDARFLLDAERSESAFVLSVLAAEELAKGAIIEWNRAYEHDFAIRDHRIKQAAFGALCSGSAMLEEVTQWAQQNGMRLAHVESLVPWERSAGELLHERDDLNRHLADSDELQALLNRHSQYTLGVLERLKHGLLYGDFGVEEIDVQNADYRSAVSRLLADIDVIAASLQSEHKDFLLRISCQLFNIWRDRPSE